MIAAVTVVIVRQGGGGGQHQGGQRHQRRKQHHLLHLLFPLFSGLSRTWSLPTQRRRPAPRPESVNRLGVLPPACPSRYSGGGRSLPCERTVLRATQSTRRTHARPPARVHKGLRSITPQGALTGPLQGHKQGRSGLRRLARNPRERSVSPPQDHDRGQNAQ